MENLTLDTKTYVFTGSYSQKTIQLIKMELDQFGYSKLIFIISKSINTIRIANPNNQILKLINEQPAVAILSTSVLENIDSSIFLDSIVVAFGFESIHAVSTMNIGAIKIYVLCKEDKKSLLENNFQLFDDGDIRNTELFDLFNIKPHSAFEFKFDPNMVFFLSSTMRIENLPFPDCHDIRNNVFDFTNVIDMMLPGLRNPSLHCENCGSVTLNSRFIEGCCRGSEVYSHFPDSPPDFIINALEENKNTANFAKNTNLLARPVILQSNISRPEGSVDMMVIQGISYAIDSCKQFLVPCHLIFNGIDTKYSLKSISEVTKVEMLVIVKFLLENNHKLREFLLNCSTKIGGSEAYVPYLEALDKGNNLAIINSANISKANSTQYALLKDTDNFKSYEKKLLDPLDSEFDQLCFPLLFWNGVGGCGKLNDTEAWKIKNMRYSCCSLFLQPPDNYIHKLTWLNEEYLTSIFSRIMYIKIEKEFQRQLLMKKLKEIADTNRNLRYDEFGTKTIIPSAFTGSNTYWKQVTHNAFLLSSIIGPPNFFFNDYNKPVLGRN